MKDKIIILSGSGKPAIRANNIYVQELSEEYDLMIIEEQIDIKKILCFLKTKLIKNGFAYILNFIFLRLYKKIFSIEKKIEKNYKPYLVINNINEESIQKILKEANYKFLISNACSILNKKTIGSAKKKIINLHNGINPRYRGTGNFWAFYENKINCVGITVHYIDEGVDTGEIITIKKDDGNIVGDGFDNIDINAFELGAREISKFILNNENLAISPEFRNLNSKCYSFPGLTNYIKAKKNFQKSINSLGNIEEIWQKSFIDNAVSQIGDSLEQQHWSDKNVVSWHDDVIVNKVNKIDEKYILDIGCGDARYAQLIQTANFYIGIDYSFETIKINKDNNYKSNLDFSFPINIELKGKNFLTKDNILLIENKASSIPIEDGSVNIILAVGLFQHLDNSEKVIKEMYRCLKSNGKIIINTLHKFSNLELLIIFLLLGWKKNIRNLVIAIYNEQYGSLVNNTLLAKRYSIKDIENNLKKSDLKIENVTYNGLFGTKFMAREIIVEASHV